MQESNQIIIAYIPIIHTGYLDFFGKYPQAKEIYLIGQDFIDGYRPLQKDLRALPMDLMISQLENLHRFDKISELTTENIQALQSKKVGIITPDEDISRHVIIDNFPDHQVIFDSIFLRWDKPRTTGENPINPDEEISEADFDQQMMDKLHQETKLSSDWWRQVASALVKDGQVLSLQRNIHLPQDMQHYSDGDPRANFSSGEQFELSTSLHAEAAVIADAAKQGISTQDCDLYATTFPCPTCAKLIAATGIKTIYYQDGYALLDGENVLKRGGVKIVRVKS